MEQKIWDRAAGAYRTEPQPQQGALRFLYQTAVGRLLLRIVAAPCFSRLAAHRYESRRSVKRIAPFVQAHGIDLSRCPRTVFTSFQDFFTRRESRSTDAPQDALIACADGKLSVYPIADDTTLPIKGSVYTVAELLQSETEAATFAGGVCLVFRLSLTDYHRYCFADDGKIITVRRISGVLHTVRPIAARERVFVQNARTVSLLQTLHFGLVSQIEVGALLVGKMVNHKTAGAFARMEEKGYFAYGGSTIVQLFRKGAVQIDNDLLAMSARGVETQIQMGEKIGNAETTA